MKKSLCFLLAGVVAIIPLTAQEAAEETSNKPVALPDPVAIVDGEKIERAELQKNFDNILANAGRTADSLPAEQQLMGYHRILDDMVIEKILDKKVTGTEVTDKEVDEGFAEIRAQFPSEEVMNEQIQRSGQSLEQIREAIRSGTQKQKWIEAQIADKIAVTEADAQEFYKSEPESFKVPEQVRASHILILTPEGSTEEVLAEKKKAIDAVAARLKKGEDFATVAKEVSEDPGSKDNGGDLDFFSKERMVAEFSEVAFKLEKDAVSEPVKSQFGYHIIKVTDKKEARDIPFEEAKERITTFLAEQKKREAVQKLITDLREKADVKIMLPEIPKPAAPEGAGS